MEHTRTAVAGVLMAVLVTLAAVAGLWWLVANGVDRFDDLVRTGRVAWSPWWQVGILGLVATAVGLAFGRKKPRDPLLP